MLRDAASAARSSISRGCRDPFVGAATAIRTVRRLSEIPRVGLE